MDQLPPTPTTTLLGEAPPTLRLRALGGQRAGSVFELAEQKCTLGAADSCTLWLDEPDLSPLHCVILRGEVHTLVRCWSPTTSLNGSPFDDALLQPGDRLTLGRVELEVLDPVEQAPVGPGEHHTGPSGSRETDGDSLPFGQDPPADR
ncbi:MAG: FHA domain-containing protein, partial [Pirellulales bacterium]